MKTVIDNAFVMSASLDQLATLATFLGMTNAQVAKAMKKKHLATVVGTKLANSPEHRDAFAAGTLEVEVEMPEPQPEPQPAAGKRSANVSAKDWLRSLLRDPIMEYTLAELVSLSGKTEVNIRTMLSDLRSPRYCGKQGVLNTKSVRKDGKVYYSRA